MDLPSWMNEFLQVVWGAVTFPARGKIKFVGDGVASVDDDPDNDQIVVTTAAGSGGASPGGADGDIQTKNGSALAGTAALHYDSTLKALTAGGRQLLSLVGSDSGGIGVYLVVSGGVAQITLPAHSTCRLKITMIASRTDAAGAARETHDLLVTTDGSAIIGTTPADWSDLQDPPDGVGCSTFTDAGYNVGFVRGSLILRIHCVGASGHDVSYLALVDLAVLAGGT